MLSERVKSEKTWCALNLYQSIMKIDLSKLLGVFVWHLSVNIVCYGRCSQIFHLIQQHNHFSIHVVDR